MDPKVLAKLNGWAETYYVVVESAKYPVFVSAHSDGKKMMAIPMHPFLEHEFVSFIQKFEKRASRFSFGVTFSNQLGDPSITDVNELLEMNIITQEEHLCYVVLCTVKPSPKVGTQLLDKLRCKEFEDYWNLDH